LPPKMGREGKHKASPKEKESHFFLLEITYVQQAPYS